MSTSRFHPTPLQGPAIGYGSVLEHLFRLYRTMKKQEKYCAAELPALLASIIPADQFSFSVKDLNRTTKYYQLALNLVCNNIYELTGHRLTAQEHKSILLLSIFCPLFDDLFDDHLLEYAQIKSLINDPENYTPFDTTDRIVHCLYLQLLQLVPRPQQFKELLQQVGYWEQESLKQYNNAIGEEELMEITYQKSFYSVLFCCSVLKHLPDTTFNKIILPLSGLMQLTNDCFDVWKDGQQGLYTIPNRYRDYRKLEALFLSEVSSINTQVAQLAYLKKNKISFLIRTHTLHAMGWMSLQQLKSVGDKPIQELSRKELVCDLDSLQQQIRWVKHLKQLCNQQNSSLKSN